MKYLTGNDKVALLKLFTLLTVAYTPSWVSAADRPNADHPNIVWLTSEDHGPEMGCYGDSLARTPNIDALAAKGMIFKHAWSTAPVCAPARTAIISGVYPSSSGGLHMRSMVRLPEGTRMYPQFLRAAGYYCTNNSKTDYNLREPGPVWDESSNKAHWENRAAGQPFFAIFNSTKSHESQIRTRPHKQITDPAKVRVPAYHPDTPEVREDWAQYYDKVGEADADAGARLLEIAAAGLAEDTIVFYYGDHGSGMPRGKRWPSNSGLHVPMVVYFPEKWQHLAPQEYKPGGASDRLVSFVDLAPTVLSLAGIQPPSWMQGHAFAGTHQTQPQPFLFGERGRMDERMDLVRSVTDGRYVYLRNYFPHVSQAQRVAYQFETPTTRVWHTLFAAGKANDAQSIFWRVPKAVEELYDLDSDRDEVLNLADSPEHRDILEKLRNAQREQILKVRDVCFLPEREIHSRSEGTTPYDMARDPARYPLERIVSAAEVSSRLEPADVPELLAQLKDTDSAVRYWGALGLLMRGADGVSANQAALQAALADQSPDVRIVAAQALGLHGDQASQELALETLAGLAGPESNGVLTSMSALAAIEALGKVAEPLHDRVSQLDPNGPSPDGRYNSYVPRLIANIVPGAKTATPSTSKGASKAKARKKNK
ncbi:MAG TPA: sulfatase-like hydrolase/transferase [Pirellulaceae bacterium]|nr:sulfatase-like hydrolase/transferase [Pirellulaceae bacterium]